MADKRLWSLKTYESDVLCSACIGSSAAGPSEKTRQAYTYLIFASCQVCILSVCYICMKLLPVTPLLSVSKQPSLLLVLNEAICSSPETQCTLSITHSALPSLRHKSFKSVLHLIPLWMSAFRAAACYDCPKRSHI